MAGSAKNPVAKAIVWVILLLLIVGLAGFGATSFGGAPRSIGQVGDTEIGIDRYTRALRQEISSFESQTGQQLSFSDAQDLGLDQAVLRQIVALAALEDEAAEIGISVGDEEVRREIFSVPAFQGMDGEFDREAYEFALNNAGLSVTEFEETLREETARSILQGAVIAGISPPAIFIDRLFEYARETRDLTLVRFAPEDLDDPVAAPTDEEIAAFYEANPEMFTLPERKRITYAWLRPEMITDDVPVDEDALRRLYEERSEEYDQPERRILDRLVFPDAAAAEEAARALAAGETDFETLVEGRGLTLDDVELGIAARTDLGEAADAVFAAESGDVAGPAPSPLGPSLYRVNAVLSAQEIPFEEVRDELQDEYALDAARRTIADRSNSVEDLLAGGATLEEIAEETEFELGEIAYDGTDPDVSGSEIDAYDAFRAIADAAEPGDFPSLEALSDGGLFALRVDGIVEPELQPLDDVTVRAIEGWERERTRERLAARAEEALAALREGDAIDALGGTVETHEGLLRDAFLENAPEDVVTRAFAAEEGEAQVVETPRGALLMRLDAVTAADGTTDAAAEIKAQVSQQMGQGIAEDLTQAFTGALSNDKGVELNSQSVSAVNAQMN